MDSSRAGAAFEHLEPRQLLAGINYDDGILNIIGYANSKTYVYVPSDLRKMVINGTPQFRIDDVMDKIGSSTPRMIRIVTGNGNDKIVFDPDVTIPAFIDSGSAKDTIVTGAGDDTIMAGPTRDRVDAGKGKNVVFAGSGDDAIQAQPGDTVWGQAGNDHLMGGVTDYYDRAYDNARQDQPAKFRMELTDTVKYGFNIVEVFVADITWTPGSLQPTVGAERLVSVNVVSNVTSGVTTTRVWATEDNSILITAVMKRTSSTRNITLSITNNGAARLTQMTFHMPYVWTQVTSDHAVLSAFRGGTDMPWPTEGYTHQNSSIWPGYAYSPMVVFYNKATTEGVGAVVFNDRLDATQVSWVLSSSSAHPWARVWPNLDTGATATYEVELFHGWNMPQQQYAHYRSTFLEPFMASKGIPEAHYERTGVWGMANWVDNGDTLANVIQRQMNQGASGFVMWSPADGLTSHYDPYRPDFPWAPQLSAASQLAGLQGLGVLINPYYSNRIPDGNGGAYQLDQYINDPAVLKLLRAQRDDMVSRGVNFAFWDNGTVTQKGSGLDYLNVLWMYKRVGVTVAVESGCDITAWVNGATIQYPHSWDASFKMARAISPHATQFVSQHFDETRVIDGKTKRWWEDAIEKGLLPILTQTQMQDRAELLGLI